MRHRARVPWPWIVGLAVASMAVSAASSPYARAQDASVVGSVDAQEVPAGATFTFTITIQGGGMSGVQPGRLEGLTNLDVVGGPNSSSSFSIGSGGVSASRAYSWFLTPRQQGTARIPSVAVQVGNKVYRTDPITITVTAAGSGQPARPQAPGFPPGMPGMPGMPGGAQGGGQTRDPGTDLRLENEVSDTRVYVGQPIVVTTRILTRVVIMDVSAGPDPTLPGFILEESEGNVVSERVFRDNREYQSYIVSRRILTPTTPGKTVIPPETRVIRVRSSSRDAFDSFFSTMRPVEITRKTSPITVEVLAPPPAGRPADFSGAVGSFSMDVDADRKEASVGDAIGLKITLSGNGNLKTVEAPALGPSADFRVFDPRVEEKASGTKPRTYTKTWSYVMTPLASGDIPLPAISFSYFDPASEKYKRLTAPATRVAVKKPGPGGGVPVSIASSPREVQTLQKDIRFLKALDGPLRRTTTPMHRTWWVWTMVLLAVAVQPAAWWLHRRGGLSSLTPGAGRGRAKRRALSDIARAGGADRDAVRASSVAAGAIQRYLGERLGIPAHGFTYDEMSTELERRGVGSEVRGELRSLLELCDLGRFAPEAGRPGATAELLGRARRLIERLDREIGRAA